MKITKRYLKRIIKEELQKAIRHKKARTRRSRRRRSRRIVKEGTIADFRKGNIEAFGEPRKEDLPPSLSELAPMPERAKWLLGHDLAMERMANNNIELVIDDDEMEALAFPEDANNWKIHHDRELELYLIQTDINFDDLSAWDSALELEED